MAITLDGTNGIGAPGTETFGDGTALGGATNPVVSMAKGADSYVQGYIVNNTNDPSSSADLVAYPSNGTDGHGWVDIGITSLAYADPVYTVTGPNEAYLFGSAPTGSGATGNLVIATDNTGTANSIQFYTGGFTQAKSAAKMTINSSGAIAYGTSYGTSGQVLTSNGTGGVPTWNTLTVSGTGGTTASGNVTLTSASSGAQSVTPTTWGQVVTLPDATTMTKAATVFNIRNAGDFPLKLVNTAGTILGFIFPQTSVVVGLADNSTSAGVWTADNLQVMAVTASQFFQGLTSSGQVSTRVSLDADRTLLLFGGSANNLYGVVYDQSTQTWGTMTLIRSAAAKNTAGLIATNTVLVVSCNTSTALQGVVLSISGTSITVNSAASRTIGATPQTSGWTFNVVGTSYVVAYNVGGTSNKAIAFTVSGTTVTIGASETTLQAALSSIAAYTVSSSVILFFTQGASTSVYAQPYTVSGTTLTNGTNATITSASSSYRVLPISSGARWVVVCADAGASNFNAYIISVSGTTATASGVTFQTGIGGAPALTYSDMIVSGNKLIVCSLNSSNYPSFNIVTDTSGTPTAGTANATLNITLTASTVSAVRASGNKAIFFLYASGSYRVVAIDYSGSSPTITSLQGISSSMDWLQRSNFDGSRSATYMNGLTYSYAQTSNSNGYRSAVVSSTNFTAIYPTQAQPSGGTTIIGAANELWYSDFDTAWGLIQRLECATV